MHFFVQVRIGFREQTSFFLFVQEFRLLLLKIECKKVKGWICCLKNLPDLETSPASRMTGLASTESTCFERSQKRLGLSHWPLCYFLINQRLRSFAWFFQSPQFLQGSTFCSFACLIRLKSVFYRLVKQFCRFLPRIGTLVVSKA